MAFTYTWQTLVDLAKKNARNIPTTDVDVLHCDLVSSAMAASAPNLWRPLTTTIGAGTLPLVDGAQDYSVPPNIYKLGDDVRITRTDVSPEQDINLNVVDRLATNMVPVTPYSIRNISHEQGVGQLRLECAVYLAAGQLFEIRGEYEINPTKVTNLTEGCWFDDKFANVAIEGLIYWLFRLAGDTRSGSATVNVQGRVTGYNGQLGVFYGMLRTMMVQEDAQAGELRIFPAEPLSEGRSGAYINPLMW